MNSVPLRKEGKCLEIQTDNKQKSEEIAHSLAQVAAIVKIWKKFAHVRKWNYYGRNGKCAIALICHSLVGSGKDDAEAEKRTGDHSS